MSKVEGGDAPALFSIGPCGTQAHSFQHLLLATLAAATGAAAKYSVEKQGHEVGQAGHGDEFTSMAVDQTVPVDAGAHDVTIMKRSTLLSEVLLSPGRALKLPAPFPPSWASNHCLWLTWSRWQWTNMLTMFQCPWRLRPRVCMTSLYGHRRHSPCDRSQELAPMECLQCAVQLCGDSCSTTSSRHGARGHLPYVAAVSIPTCSKTQGCSQ